MPARKYVYFASDFHLGMSDRRESREREHTVVRWLESIRETAAELYLMGDVFDFWFEYRHTVPKGHLRFLGKLAQLADEGVKITLFRGNHDMWMFDYFREELGATIIANDLMLELGGKSFYLHHGDGLGPGDYKYKFLKKIFRSPLCQGLFAWIHPNLGIGIARAWSRNSRLAHKEKESFMGEEKEWLIVHSKAILQHNHFDYLIYGHRHLPLDVPLAGPDGRPSRYLNLGEWINHCSYAVFDGNHLELRVFLPL